MPKHSRARQDKRLSFDLVLNNLQKKIDGIEGKTPEPICERFPPRAGVPVTGRTLRPKKNEREIKMVGGFVTRDGACRILGISIAELRRREEDGKVPFVVDQERGWRLFDPNILIEMSAVPGAAERARPYLRVEEPVTRVLLEPDLIAAVFEDLRGGKNPAHIVIDRKMDPDVVRRLVIKYHELDRSLSLSSHHLERLRRIDWEGAIDFTTGDGFVDMIVNHLENEQ